MAWHRALPLLLGAVGVVGAIRLSGPKLSPDPKHRLPSRKAGYLRHPTWRDSVPFAPPLSRVGSPKMHLWTNTSVFPTPPYSSDSPASAKLGDDLLQAVSVDEATLKACGAVWSFGDYSFCARAMPRETRCASAKGSPCGAPLPASTLKMQNQPEGGQFQGLSYGIRERDLWSEFLSTRYRVPTRLYDCYWNQPIGPMMLNKLAENLTAPVPCKNWRHSGGCYGAPYEPKRVCIGAKKDTVHKLQSPGKKLEVEFDTLKSTMRGLAPMSTFLKIDIEGSEWDVLDQFLSDPEEVGKVRTLNMEVHVNKYAPDRDNLGAVRLPWKIEVLRRLTKKFAPFASTVEVLSLDEFERLAFEKTFDANFTETEPQVHNTQGFKIEQFCMSFVNRDLLKGL